MSFAVYISEVLRKKSKDGLNQMNQTPRNFLNEIEAKSLEFINNHISTYGDFPSIDTFRENHMSVYRQEYSGDSLDFLYDKFIDHVKELHTKRFLSDLEISLAKGEQLSKTSLIDKIKSLPEHPKSEDSCLSSDVSDDLFLGANPNEGFYLGLKQIDDEVGSVTKGKIFSLIAHKKSGKTTVSCVFAVKAFTEGKKVLYCTYEQGKQEILRKISAIIGNFNTKLYRSVIGSADFTLLQTKKDLVKHRIASYESKGGKLFVHQASGTNVEKLKFMLKKEQENTGRPYDLVFVDGFYLMPSLLEGWQGYEQNMQSLKLLCLGDDSEGFSSFGLIVTSQFDPKSTGDSSADIAKTRAIAETSDVVIGIVPDESKMPSGRIVKVLENRDGLAHGVAQAIDINFGTTMINQMKGVSTYEPIVDISGFGLVTVELDEDDENEEE